MSEVDLQRYISSFHSHADALCQVARFVAAGCPHAKSEPSALKTNFKKTTTNGTRNAEKKIYSDRSILIETVIWISL